MTGNRRLVLIATGGGIAAVLIAAALVLVFAGGTARRPLLRAGTASVTTSTAPFAAPAGTAGPVIGAGGALPIPVEDARAVVVRYLDDINTQNRSDAASLICTRLVGDWRKKIDQPGGDFTLAVVRAVFRGAAGAPAGVALSYDLDTRPRDSDQVNTNTVTFTVVGSPGSYRLCGES